ncbi:NAD(P)/FAD-dependent oxidoreductase [Streptomyces sp. NPDC056405]|uniref:NAD(P)/FAD-dependent oxidoreductase n=1 Tax=Streptomyces sp. NPDC056405 TaxID=3345811 RepID=UPI0035D6F70F
MVGAGHGGAHAASALRQAGFEGSVALLGEEPELPYERPPLSKDYLSGEKRFERLLIRPSAFWHERNVALLGGKVISVDPSGHRVHTAAGAEIAYGTLIWATGGAPRRLACRGHDLPGVHTLRSRVDADRIRAELPTTGRVVVVGGGYIGLESAAVLSKVGKDVTVLETQNRVLARVAGEPLSRFYEREHRSHGVDIQLDASVVQVEEKAGRVAGVQLADGRSIDCDMVIVGIGIAPAVEPLLRAGAKGSNGVEVDRMCRTNLPDILAIGDCAVRRHRYANEAFVRLESVQNAHEQASVAAKALTGATAIDDDAVPWFWSHQYDLRLQTVGLAAGHDDIVVRGDPAARRFSLVYLREGRVIALDSVNVAKDFVQGKRLVALGARVEAALLRDMTIALKDLGRGDAPSPRETGTAQ